VQFSGRNPQGQGQGQSSSNPAFRNLGQVVDAQRASNPTPATLQEMYNQPSYTAPPAARQLTLDDVVTKTAMVLGVGVIAAVATIMLDVSTVVIWPALIVGLVLSLIVIFKKSTNPVLILSYAVAEGILLGAITGVFESIPQYQGIGVQALVGTFGVFAGMLIVYKTGAIRVTPRFTRLMVGALIGVAVLVVFRLLGSLFGFADGMSSGGPLSIIISLVIIAVAAFSFLLDFDQIDRAIRAGAPAKTSWYFAFGLMVTLVWLYLEILRLLSYLRQN